MRPEIHDILTNKEVIAVNQDALGIEGKPVRKDSDTEVFVKPLSGGNRAVILFNRETSKKRNQCELARFGISRSLQCDSA